MLRLAHRKDRQHLRRARLARETRITERTVRARAGAGGVFSGLRSVMDGEYSEGRAIKLTDFSRMNANRLESRHEHQIRQVDPHDGQRVQDDRTVRAGPGERS